MAVPFVGGLQHNSDSSYPHRLHPVGEVKAQAHMTFRLSGGWPIQAFFWLEWVHVPLAVLSTNEVWRWLATERDEMRLSGWMKSLETPRRSDSLRPKPTQAKRRLEWATRHLWLFTMPQIVPVDRSRANGTGFVSGHGFSRAAISPRTDGAKAP